MKKFLALVLLMSLPAIASKEVGCICLDTSTQVPKGGICGFDTGHMEQTDTGAKCFCGSGLQVGEKSCAETCEENEGWKGKFAS